MKDSIYTLLTQEFNQTETRAILSSGQAVVLHRLAIMSKDGDWIVKESPQSLNYILSVLATKKATYRFGAPLDIRWLKAGWSSHLEFQTTDLRVRTDFVSRPPRLLPAELEELWRQHTAKTLPFVDTVTLAKLKMTSREKDYPIIGELARKMTTTQHQLLFSRSARDLQKLCRENSELANELVGSRPLLKYATMDLGTLERALDEERRILMHSDERRLAAFADAAKDWYGRWPNILKMIEGKNLLTAHEILVKQAINFLPTEVTWS